AFLRTGMGGERAAAAIGAHVEMHRPEVVLLVGFAGGLDTIVAVGDVLRIVRVRDERGRETLVGPARAGRLTDGLGPSSLLSVDRVVTTPGEKERLFKTHLAAAVDMETFAVARALRPLGVELIVLRAITDPADTALPAASRHWVTPDGRPRVVRPTCW